MPKETTHVLEIEKGVGEPSFIPLTEGEELQPISVGKRGQWRVDGPRVLDVHAYLYYDGQALFAQSTDDTAPVQVSGRKIGKEWTEVEVPCRLFLGSVILRCRSLAEDDDSATMAQEGGPPVNMPVPKTMQSGGAPLPDLSPDSNEDPTMARPSPLDRANAPSVRPAAGVPSAGAPRTQLMDARPFAPGAFVTRDVESTRDNPLPDFPKRGASMGHHGSPPVRPPGAGVPSAPPLTIVQEGQPMHVTGGRPAAGGFAEASVQVAPHLAAEQSGSNPAYARADALVAPPAPPEPVFPPGAGGGPAYDPAFGPPGAAPYDPAFAPPPPPAAPEPVKAGEGAPSLARFKAEWRAASPVKKATWFMFPLVLMGGLAIVFDDDDAPKPRRKNVKTLPDGGVIARDGGAGVAVATPPTTPPTAPISPTVAPTAPTAPNPTESATAPVAGSAPPPRASASASAVASAAPPEPASSNSPGATAKEKSMERQAVDALAEGNNQKALELYTELSKQNPNNQAFQQMVRILTARKP